MPAGLYRRTALFAATAGLWKRLAALESAVLRGEIEKVGIDRPVFVAGVARSGTTIITEMLSRHPDVTCHRYSDFPNFYTPYWRNWLVARTRRGQARPVERAHRDRLMVTPESPEAVEETIWMQFFDHLHDPSANHVLDASTSNPAFERFYRDHIRKLLLVRGRQRYLAKGNYNVTRLGYLLKLFPDARFIVPVRNPVNHVASLVKQDRLFQRLAGEDPRVATQLHRSGHFEFGPGKRCIKFGDEAEARGIEGLWAEGRSAEGWARYWNTVYRGIRVATELDGSKREAITLVRYEDLCGKPGPVIDRLLAHAGLPVEPFETVRREFAASLSEPDYYAPEFTPEELQAIESVTAETAQWCGY